MAAARPGAQTAPPLSWLGACLRAAADESKKVEGKCKAFLEDMSGVRACMRARVRACVPANQRTALCLCCAARRCLQPLLLGSHEPHAVLPFTVGQALCGPCSVPCRRAHVCLPRTNVGARARCASPFKAADLPVGPAAACVQRRACRACIIRNERAEVARARRGAVLHTLLRCTVPPVLHAAERGAEERAAGRDPERVQHDNPPRGSESVPGRADVRDGKWSVARRRPARPPARAAGGVPLCTP